MRKVTLWRALLGVENAVVEDVAFDEEAQVVVARVRPNRRRRGRCGVCGSRAPGYDRGEGRRRWRGLDLGLVRVFLEAEAPRVSCPVHGPTVAQVPWARHGAGHTRGFDQMVAWLATTCSKTAITQLMRIAWRTVGSIIARVWADVRAGVGDGLDGLTRIGIDEISYRRGLRFLTVVVDHDTGRLLWAAPGRDRPTLRRFFDQLGVNRSAQITLVSADAAPWIADVVAERCPAAVQCADPFHVVKWATDALDEVRRQAWNDARRAPGGAQGPKRRGGQSPRDASGAARALKHARYALWKNPQNLTERQQHKLAWIAKTDPRLYRAYLLKEALRYVFAVKGTDGQHALDRWLSWARRSRIPAFVDLARRVTRIRPSIDATLEHGLSNALVESMNTKIRLITRTAYGFHSATALIALAMLTLSGHRPTLPNRT
ncbi:MAG: ISL3 family transposase [Lapillicoccus sp.]